jgi:hypothetical protein
MSAPGVAAVRVVEISGATDPGSVSGVDGEGVQVVGQDRPVGPDPLPLVALQPAAPQPVAALEWLTRPSAPVRQRASLWVPGIRS